MDNLLTLLAAAGCTFVMGIPGSDDIMLNYQTTSFHDALYVRKLLGLRPAPEFESWLTKMQIVDDKFHLNARMPSQFSKNLLDVKGEG
jgi:ethanolamine ammonia-lyase large subunit